MLMEFLLLINSMESKLTKTEVQCEMVLTLYSPPYLRLIWSRILKHLHIIKLEQQKMTCIPLHSAPVRHLVHVLLFLLTEKVAGSPWANSCGEVVAPTEPEPLQVHISKKFQQHPGLIILV